MAPIGVTQRLFEAGAGVIYPLLVFCNCGLYDAPRLAVGVRASRVSPIYKNYIMYPIFIVISLSEYGLFHLSKVGSDDTLCGGLKNFERVEKVFSDGDLPKRAFCKRCAKLISNSG